MSRRSSQHVFGPVPSRRLGRSLGVDLVPFKTCTFDCIYCQLGRTTTHTTERAEFVPFDEVVTEIGQALSAGPRPDYITLAGSGEPTLYSRLGELIDRIHELTDVPADVLTNGSLLFDEYVRNEVARADLIIPSLDAGDEETFVKINRPAKGIEFQTMLSGLQRFCQQCGSKTWLEVFLVKGINDDDAHVGKIAAIVKTLNVARVQLNTAVRPAAEGHVHPVDPVRLTELAQRFDPPAEVIADFPESRATETFQADSNTVLDMLRRRPCTLQDITAGLAIAPAEAVKIIETLSRSKKIKPEDRCGRLYYVAT